MPDSSTQTTHFYMEKHHTEMLQLRSENKFLADTVAKVEYNFEEHRSRVARLIYKHRAELDQLEMKLAEARNANITDEMLRQEHAAAMQIVAELEQANQEKDNKIGRLYAWIGASEGKAELATKAEQRAKGEKEALVKTSETKDKEIAFLREHLQRAAAREAERNTQAQNVNVGAIQFAPNGFPGSGYPGFGFLS